MEKAVTLNCDQHSDVSACPDVLIAHFVVSSYRNPKEVYGSILLKAWDFMILPNKISQKNSKAMSGIKTHNE